MSNNTLQGFEVLDTIRNDMTGATAIHYWALNDVASSFVSAKEDPKNYLFVQDTLGNTALHYASSTSSYNVAEFFMKYDPDFSYFNNELITPAHIAAQRGDVKMLSIFTKSNHLLKDLSKRKWNPLHFAVFFGREEATKFLLDYEPFLLHQLVNGSESTTSALPHQTMKYFSALSMSDFMKNSSISSLLLSYNAFPSLHTAAYNNDYQACSYLVLSKNSKCDVNIISAYRSSTPLIIAAALGHYNICQFLLTNGARTSIEDSSGFCALELAVISNDLNTVTVIQKHCTDLQRARAIAIASHLRSETLILEIVKSQIDWEYALPNGDPLLLHMIKNGMHNAAELVCDKITNFDQRDKYGATALHYASITMNEVLLTKIIKKTHNIDQKDSNGITPLGYAVRAGNFPGAALLRANKADPYLVDFYGISPNLLAFLFEIGEEHFNIQQLVESHFTIKVREFVESARPDPDPLKYPNYKVLGEKTAECKSIPIICEQLERMKNSESASLYIKRCGDIAKECSLLHVMMLFSCSSSNIVNIMKQMEDMCFKKDGNGRSLLIWAAITNNYGLVHTLQEKKLDLNGLDNNKSNFFHYLYSKEMFDSIKMSGTDIKALHSSPNYKGQNPLHCIAQIGNFELLSAVIGTMSENMSSILALDTDGLAPIDYAIQSKSNKCVQFLYSIGSRNRFIDAAEAGNLHEVEKFVALGYPIDSTNSEHETALIVSVKMGHTEIAKFLLSKGADNRIMTKRGKTAVHFAALNNNLALSKLLLANNLDITSFNQDDQPYNLTTDFECKKFLYKWWKRLVSLSNFFKFIEKNILVNNKVADKLSVPKIAKHVLNHIRFVCNQITQLSFNGSRPYSFSRSVHFLLTILETIPFVEHTNIYMKGVQDLIHCTVSKTVDHFVSSYPFLFFSHLMTILSNIKDATISEIDDEYSVNSIYNKLSIKYNDILKNLGCPSEPIRKFLTTQLRNPLPSSVQTEIPQTFVRATVTYVIPNPRCILSLDEQMLLHHFYGSSDVMTRSIPFVQGDEVYLFVIGDYLFIAPNNNKRSSFNISLSLCFFRSQNDSVGFILATPIGQASFRFLEKDVSTLLFELFISYRFRTEVFPCLLSSMKMPKRIFTCLAFFFLAGSKFVETRILTIFATSEEECYEICLKRIKENYSSNPIMLHVRAKETMINDETIVIIE